EVEVVVDEEQRLVDEAADELLRRHGRVGLGHQQALRLHADPHDERAAGLALGTSLLGERSAGEQGQKPDEQRQERRSREPVTWNAPLAKPHRTPLRGRRTTPTRHRPGVRERFGSSATTLTIRGLVVGPRKLGLCLGREAITRAMERQFIRSSRESSGWGGCGPLRAPWVAKSGLPER